MIKYYRKKIIVIIPNNIGFFFLVLEIEYKKYNFLILIIYT